MKFLAGVAGAAICLAAAAPGQAADVAGTKAAIDAGLDRGYPKLETLYRDIHQNPELGFQEKATAAKPVAVKKTVAKKEIPKLPIVRPAIGSETICTPCQAKIPATRNCPASFRLQSRS